LSRNLPEHEAGMIVLWPDVRWFTRSNNLPKLV